MKLKKIILIFLLAVIVLSVIFLAFYSGKISKKIETNKMNIVVTNFVAYDFVKHITGDKVNVVLIVSPGVESHNYDPTAHDLALIENSDLFIYIGGEVESWATRIIETTDLSQTKLLCLLDTVELIEESEVDGAEKEEHHEEQKSFDEHIWTSPANAIKMMQGIEQVISKLDEKNEQVYHENANKYISEIKQVQGKIQEIVDNKVRNRLIFADKMPMQYFVNEFGLEVSAAFSGCSSGTIAYLIDKIKEEKIPVVLYIELSTGNIAKTISEETGCEMLRIESLHNVTKNDFDNGETYVSLMTRNLDVLKKALQ